MYDILQGQLQEQCVANSPASRLKLAATKGGVKTGLSRSCVPVCPHSRFILRYDTINAHFLRSFCVCNPKS